MIETISDPPGGHSGRVSGLTSSGSESTDTQRQVVNETATTARRFIKLGINVVPIPPRSKAAAVEWRSLIADRRQINDDIDQLDARIDRWWGVGSDHGLAIVTGPASGILGVDIDDDTASEFLLTVCGRWPHTVEVLTASGRHLWFRRPAGGSFRNRMRAEGYALDGRGDGGLLVCPPSIHASGAQYQWVNSPLDVWPPAEMPQALGDVLWPVTPQPHAVAPTSSSVGQLERRSSAYVEAALANACVAVQSAGVGTRNDTLNREAHSIFRFVPTRELNARRAADALEAAAVSAGLPRAEARQTLNSALGARLGTRSR